MLFSALPNGYLGRTPRRNVSSRSVPKIVFFFLPEQVVVGLMDRESYKNCFPVYNGDLKIWGSSTEYHCFFLLVSLQGFFLMLIIHHQNAFIYSVLFDFVNHLKSSLEKRQSIKSKNLYNVSETNIPLRSQKPGLR